MSVRVLNSNSSSNTDVKSKTLSSKVSTPWIRNPSWPACEANSGDNRVRGLYAVWPDGANFISIRVGDSFTVDYGDGTTTNYGSFATAYYEYAYSAAALVGTEAPVTFTDAGDLVTRTAHGYSNGMQVRFFNITSTTGISNAQVYYVINATANTFQVAAAPDGGVVTLTTNGTGQLLPYRIATVTITPQAGSNITNLDLMEPHNQVFAGGAAVPGYNTGWLDLAFAVPTLTSLIIANDGAGVNYVRFNNIERVRLNQLGAVTSFNSLFKGLSRLQHVEIADTITSVTDMGFMFQDCVSLRAVPLFNTAAVTIMTSMFVGCVNLQTVPMFNTAAVDNMVSMFRNCRSLRTVPLFNTAAVTDISQLFENCASLQTVPLFNTVAVTNMFSMFGSCSSLRTVPLFNTALVNTMQSMFSGCTSLQTVPLFNTAAVTIMQSMFSSCTDLRTVPLFNTALVTNMQSMFFNCSELQTVPLFNTALVTNMNSMFSSCSCLQTVPLFNTAATTNMGGMFSSCSCLQTVPLFNTALVTNMSSMFSACTSLQTVPLFNTALVTDMTSMFSSCFSLTAVPAMVTTAVTSGTNFTDIFLSCVSITRIEAKDFRFTFSVLNCKLSATALNEIYTNLPTVVGQTITVTGNYGRTADTPSIATAKGWTVTG